MELATAPADVPDHASKASELPEPKKKSLGDLLSDLTRIEKIVDGDDREWDVAEIVGDLKAETEETRAALRLKVDALDYVVAELHAYAERTKRRADNMLRRVSSARMRAEGLTSYILVQMSMLGFDQLTGHDRVIKRVTTSSAALFLERQPAAEDVLGMEEFVHVVPTSYEWKKDTIKKALKAGHKFDFARLTYSQSVKFDDRDKPDVAPKKKGKRK